MELILAIGVLAAVIWIAVLTRKFYTPLINAQLNPVILTGVASILVGIVFGPSFLSIPAGPIPITLDRILLGVMFAMFALRFLIGKEGMQAFSGTDMVIMGLLAVLVISTAMHDYTYRDNLPLSRLLFFNILPIGLYFVTKNARLSEGDLKLVLVAFSLLCIYLSLTAFAETREWNWAIYPSYIMDPSVQEFLGRGRGPLHNPVINGILIVTGTCCTFLLAQRFKHRKFLFAAALLATLIGCLGAYATLTRIVWFSLLATLSIVVWTTLSGVRRRAFTILVIVGFVGIVGVAKSGALNGFKRDKHVTVHEMSKSAGLRVIFYVIAKDMFADKPILGHGFAHYTEARQGYLTLPDAGSVETTLGGEYIQHNIVLSYLTETGLFGTFFLLATLGTLTYIGFAVWINPNQSQIAQQTGLILTMSIFAYFACGMVQDVTVIAMANMLLFFWGGLASNLYSRDLALQRASQQMQTMPSETYSEPVNARPGFSQQTIVQ